MYIYINMYVYLLRRIHLHISICTYTCIERAAAQSTAQGSGGYLLQRIHLHIFIFTYTYTETAAERSTAGGSGRHLLRRISRALNRRRSLPHPLPQSSDAGAAPFETASHVCNSR